MKKSMKLWSREPANSANSQYKYRLFAPAAPVVLAHARLAVRAIQLKWKSTAKMEFSFQPTAEMEFSFQPTAEMEFSFQPKTEMKIDNSIGRAARPLPSPFI
jgi:hypothetical protein